MKAEFYIESLSAAARAYQIDVRNNIEQLAVALLNGIQEVNNISSKISKSNAGLLDLPRHTYSFTIDLQRFILDQQKSIEDKKIVSKCIDIMISHIEENHKKHYSPAWSIKLEEDLQEILPCIKQNIKAFEEKLMLQNNYTDHCPTSSSDPAASKRELQLAHFELLIKSTNTQLELAQDYAQSANLSNVEVYGILDGVGLAGTIDQFLSSNPHY